jgi:hypothetical protein
VKNQKSIDEQAEAVRGTRHSSAEACNLIRTLNYLTHGSEIARAELLQSFECRIVSVLKSAREDYVQTLPDLFRIFTSGIQLANKLSKEREDGKLGFHLKESLRNSQKSQAFDVHTMQQCIVN